MFTEERMRTIKDRLKNNGLKEFDNIDDHYLKTKHVSRHISLLAFIKQNNIEMSSLVLNRLYRADVVTRQEIWIVLQPIEMKIKSFITYYLEFHNITIDMLVGGTLFEPIDGFRAKLASNRAVNDEFLIESLNSLCLKYGPEPSEWVPEMMFGQLSSLIRALDKEIVFEIIGKEKNKIINPLRDLINMRNHIAHGGLLFVSGDLKINEHVTVKLNSMMNSIEVIAGAGYKNQLKVKLDDYFSRVQAKETEEHSIEVTKLFTAVKHKLFGI